MDTERTNAVVDVFAAKCREAGQNDLDGNQRGLLEGWLMHRIGGQDRDQTDLALVETFNGVPMIALLGESGVRLVGMAGLGENAELTTRYLPPLRGGSYSEHLRNVDEQEGGRLELDAVFRHGDLPGELRFEWRLAEEIDTPQVQGTRDLLRTWAEGTP